MAKANLNNYVEWFKLVIDSTTYSIDEPIGWDKIEISLERNEQYYGFDYEVLGETATLEFNFVDGVGTCIVGGNLLIDQYGLHGQDAEVLFIFGYTDENDIDIVVYESTIDYNLYNLNNSTVKVGARRISFDDLFRNRFETAINLTSDEDLDGNAITPLTLDEVILHSKGIFKTSERESPNSFAFNSGLCSPAMTINNSGLLELRYESNNISAGVNTVFRSKTFYAQPSLGGIITEDLGGNQNIPDGIGDTGVNAQWIMEDAGELTIDLGLAWDASIHPSKQWKNTAVKANLKIEGCTRGDARMGYASIKLKLKVGATVHTLFTKEDNNGGCDLKILSTNNFIDKCIIVPVGNQLTSNDDVPLSYNFDNTSVDDFENTPPLQNFDPEWTTFSVTTNVSIGDEIALYVEIYGEGDYNENTIFPSDLGWFGDAVFWQEDTSGTPNQSFMNMNIKSFSPDSTAKTALIHEAGATLIEVMTGDANRLRSDLLGRTDSTPVYASDGCASLNGITGGFQIRNFEEDERPITTTFAEYISSIQAIYNVGMALEKDGADDVVRVEEVNYFFNPELMLTLDSPSSYKESVATELIYNSIKIGYDKFLDEGLNLLDEFNTEHEYSTPIRKHKNEKLIICSYSASGYMIETQRREQFDTSPSSSAENDDTNFIINLIRNGGSNFKSLRDEGFTSVSGVFSPTSSYNLKISPKRMLYRWAKWLKSSYRYKNQATEFIRFVFGFQNKDLTTEIAASCEQGGVILESANVLLEDFPDSSNGIYSPEWVEYEHVLKWSEFAALRDKLKGAGGGTDNYGYIKVLSPLTNDYVDLWIYGANYNISNQSCRFKGLKADL